MVAEAGRRSKRNDEAGQYVELPAGCGFEVAPHLVCPIDQRHVVGMLEVGPSDDAGVAVGAAAVVGDVELFDAEDALAAAGEVTGGGASHAADAEGALITPPKIRGLTKEGERWFAKGARL